MAVDWIAIDLVFVFGILAFLAAAVLAWRLSARRPDPLNRYAEGESPRVGEIDEARRRKEHTELLGGPAALSEMRKSPPD